MRSSSRQRQLAGASERERELGAPVARPDAPVFPAPTLNAHINKIGKFDIDPNRGSLLGDLIERGKVAAGADFH